MIDNKNSGFLFIINPNSGNGTALKTEGYIRKLCEKKKIRYSINTTKKAGDASEIARKGLVCGFEGIVAVGGDGTVNEVGKELVNQNIALGIVPTGSGNGLARHMKIPMNRRRAINRVLRGRKKIIDTGLIDGITFLNAAGIGFDAAVSKAFANSQRRGWLNYLKIVLKLGRNTETLQLVIKNGDASKKVEVVMLTFANSSQFGNNATIAPKADIADGKMDVCLLAPTSFIKALLFLLKIMIGQVAKNEYFDTYQCEEIAVSGTKGLAHSDGDPIEIGQNIKVKINPKSLSIIC